MDRTRSERSAGSASHLHSLTPLRGIAAFWVVLYHYIHQYLPSLDPEAHTQILDKGYLAVDLFFLLSGFVMTHVYRDTFAPAAQGERPPGGYWQFITARVARLYPMHLWMLGLFMAVAVAVRILQYAATGRIETIPLDGARSISALVANLFLLQGLHASALSWNYPAWSISTEFMAYLVFPFVLPWVSRASRAVQFGLVVLAFAILAHLSDFGRDLNQWNGVGALLRCGSEFLLGILLYLAFRNGRVEALASHDALVLAVLGALLLLLHTGASDLVTVALFAALILSAVANAGRIAGLLNVAPLIWLGEVSYSLYLIHEFVQYVTSAVLEQGFGITRSDRLPEAWSWALMLAMVSVSLLLADLGYRRIELVGRRRLRRALSALGTGAAK